MSAIDIVLVVIALVAVGAAVACALQLKGLRAELRERGDSDAETLAAGSALLAHRCGLALVILLLLAGLDLLLAGDISGTVAIRAFLLDNLTGTAAVRTCLDILYLAKERLLCIDDLTFSVTFRTGSRLCSRLCTSSVTLATRVF